MLDTHANEQFLTDPQFYDKFYEKHADYDCGEMKLLDAMLQGALYDIEKYRLSGAQRRRYNEALAWITEKQTDWVFTFANVCMALQLDPSAVRARLLKLYGPNGQPEPKAVKPKRIFGSKVYCRCGCRSPGRWRNVCREVYDEATYRARRSRPSDRDIMAVLEERVRR